MQKNSEGRRGPHVAAVNRARAVGRSDPRRRNRRSRFSSAATAWTGPAGFISVAAKARRHFRGMAYQIQRFSQLPVGERVAASATSSSINHRSLLLDEERTGQSIRAPGLSAAGTIAASTSIRTSTAIPSNTPSRTARGSSWMAAAWQRAAKNPTIASLTARRALALISTQP